MKVFCYGLLPSLILLLSSLLFLNKNALIIFSVLTAFVLGDLFRGVLRRELYWLLLGILTPVVTLIQVDLLLFLALLIVFTGEGSVSRTLRHTWPFLSLLIVSLLATLVVESYNIQSWIASIFVNGLSNNSLQLLRATFRDYHFPGALQYINILKYFLFFGLLYNLHCEPSEYQTNYLKGVFWGSLLAFLFVVLELNYSELQVLFDSTTHWKSIGRISGSFQDPNAFGIFAFLMLPLCHLLVLQSSSKLLSFVYIFFGVLWILLAPYSGSRSFFVGVFTYLCVIAFFKSRRVFFLGILGGLLVLLSISVFGSTILEISQSAPQGLSRFFHALQISAFWETFHSRLVFWNIALQVWFDNIAFGIGPTQFALSVVAYADKFDLGTQFWTDNTNSFYLEVLAELGLVGCILFITSFLGLRTHDMRPLPNDRKVACATIAAMVIMFFFGPHFHFVQILLPCTVIATLYFKDSCSYTFASWRVPTYLLLIGAFFVRRLYPLQFGAYHWERGGDHFLRWTRPQSRLSLSCSLATDPLKLRMPIPGIHKRPVTVTVTLEYGEEARFVIRGHEVHEIDISCTETKIAGNIHDNVQNILIEASHGFLPFLDIAGATDIRLLGPQLIENTADRMVPE